jgi:bifunctional non-homologous end joining protein LigD
VQLHIADAIRIFTRRGHDWTNRFKKIAHDAWRLNVKSAIIDGEVIVPAANDVSDFAVLQRELRGNSDKLTLYAIDLLYLNGYDLRGAPLVERKALLQSLLKDSGILFSESFETDGATIFKSACKMGLEGIVSKRRDSRYQSGRTNNWVKVTCQQRETLAIVGYSMKDNRFDGLYLGRKQGKELIYAGKVDHGFSPASAKDVRDRLTPLVQKTQAYSRKIKRRAIWVKPSLLVEIEYRAKSAEGKLRHPFFKGVREDL